LEKKSKKSGRRDRWGTIKRLMWDTRISKSGALQLGENTFTVKEPRHHTGGIKGKRGGKGAREKKKWKKKKQITVVGAGDLFAGKKKGDKRRNLGNLPRKRGAKR